MTTKLRIIARAIQIRLDKGEILDDIFESYPALTLEEKEELSKYFKEV